MKVPEGCKTLKIERICHNGFLWAFEFLNYPGVTQNKKKLIVLENYMSKSLTNKAGYGNNFAEDQFVAVVKSGLKTVVRGYVLLFNPDRRGGTYDVFLIDYGKVEKIHAGDLRKLPEYASVEKLPAQSWRIGIYGVLPLHIELQFGKPASKKVGESWNGKDVIFIENVLRDYDIVEFHEVKRFQEYRFGYIYLRDPESQSINTLQKLLVDRGYAVEEEDFDKYIPSIVKRIKSTPDHVSFPIGNEYDDSNFNDPPNATLEVDSKTAEVPTPPPLEPVSSETSSNESRVTVIPAQTSPQTPSISVPGPAPKAGKGRGELLKRLQPQKAPPLQLSPMIGRLPLNVSDQFDDSIETVYCDAVSSLDADSSPSSSSSVGFLTPRKGSPSMSRRQSSSLSSSIEITGVTRARDQPEIETISLLTPPRDPPTISLISPRDEMQTVDLATPPTVSLITPSPSPHDRGSSEEDSSRSSASLSRRGKGRGELLRSISIPSSQSPTSQDDLNERLSELKLMTAPPLGARGRGALLSQFFNQSKVTFGTPAAAEPLKPSRVNFAKEIVELEPIRVDSDIDEEEQVASFDNDELDSNGQQLGSSDKVITKIMVLGNEGVCRFKPKFSIDDFDDLHSSITSRANQLRIFDLRRCQRYMIAAMLTRRNVTLVDASKTGKTVSCLIALFSLLKTGKLHKTLPVGPGPRAIILCPFSSQCESIDRQCKELNKSVETSSVFPGKEILKINVAYGCGSEAEKDKLRELTQGYDIVITTPSCLLRLLETPEMMNLKRLCHLVLDDADTLFSSYREEMEKILDNVHECTKKYDDLILPQQVIICKEWIPKLKNRVQKEVTEQRGVLLMSSYYEAAIFSKVRALLRRIDDEDKKRYNLLNYLNVEEPERSTVIVFNTVEEMNETYTWLKPKCTRPMHKVSYLLGYTDEIVANWKISFDKNEYPIMCCTDGYLHDLNLHEANSLIHYNLPPQERGYFNERFCVLLNRLAGPPEFYTPGKMPLMFSRAQTLIYIKSTDRRQFPVILEFLKKLPNPIIPEYLEIESKKLMKERELEKDGNGFCENYKKFGRCMNEKLCKSRHYFSQKYDQPAADLPRQGFVKMKILQVYSASHYRVRLLEHRYGSNKWNEITSIVHPGVLSVRVNMYFSDHSKRSMHICKEVGEVAAIETTTNMFKRVQVLELKKDDRTDELKTVKVKFIDDGKIDDVRPSVLVKLSDELASIPPTSVDIFLCNVLPVDRDIEWGDIINNKVRDKIDSLQESENVLFIGEIQLVAGRDVWINPLQCHKLYDKGKEVIVILSSMSNDLTKKKLASKNPDHLPKLLSMYRSAELLELPDPAIEPVIESPRVENVVESRNTNEPLRSSEGKPSSDNINQLNDTNGNESHHHLNSESLNETKREDATTNELEMTSVNSSNAIKTLNESCSVNREIASSEPGPSSSIIGQPNHTDSDSADHEDESEEEWPLADEPQTAAAPVRNPSKPSSQNDGYDSEYDLYDYETDSMEIEGLDDNKFDCFFSPEAAKMLINQLYPGFEPYMKAVEGRTQSTRTATEPKKQPLTIREVNDSKASEVPAITAAPLDMNTNVFKPNVEWYQDPEFVYMNILLNVEDYTIRIESDRIYFRAIYDERVYEFDEVLFTTIDENTSKCFKSGVTVNVKMEKIIKRNKWTRIFKNKLATKWIKKSNEHLDEDIKVPEMCWEHKLYPGLALREPEIPNDFSYHSNYNSSNITIYPDGYEDYLPDSDDDSDAICNDNDGEE